MGIVKDKNGLYVSEWWRTDTGWCWFAEGIPAMNGTCAYCGRLSKTHYLPMVGREIKLSVEKRVNTRIKTG